MLPSQIAKESEHSHQCALFAYCAIATLHGFERADAWCVSNDIKVFMDSPKIGVPELKWFHAIHNQGHGDAIRGAKAKAEGVKPGVADCFLPVVKMIENEYCNGCPDELKFAGLYIEMKKPSEKPKREGSKGGLSDAQIEFKNFVESQGYKWEVCYSWQEAVEVIKEYLK